MMEKDRRGGGREVGRKVYRVGEGEDGTEKGYRALGFVWRKVGGWWVEGGIGRGDRGLWDLCGGRLEGGGWRVG